MKVCILGTGAYGLALANMFNQNNNDIVLWSKYEDEIKNLKETRCAKSLKDVTLPDFNYTSSMEEAVKDKSELEREDELIRNIIKTIHIQRRNPL